VSTFQRAIEFVLGEDLLSTNVRVYLDDILIFYENSGGTCICTIRESFGKAF
jgi:hypothetical protein